MVSLWQNSLWKTQNNKAKLLGLASTLDYKIIHVSAWVLTQEEEKAHKQEHKKIEYKPKICKTTDNDMFWG